MLKNEQKKHENLLRKKRTEKPKNLPNRRKKKKPTEKPKNLQNRKKIKKK